MATWFRCLPFWLCVACYVSSGGVDMIILLTFCLIAFAVSIYVVIEWTTDFYNGALGFAVLLSYVFGVPATVVQLVRWFCGGGEC